MTATAAARDGLPDPGARPLTASGLREVANRIVVGVDGSPGSLAALRWAAAEAGRRMAALRIVSAWEDPDRDPACRACPPAASLAAAVVQDALDLVVCLDGRPGSVSCVVPEGEPGKVLVEQARDGEMLILGAGADAGPGSTLRYCLRYAPCPLVFVRA
jgi:nucleotide-binding universal stress UspA family protein